MNRLYVSITIVLCLLFAFLLDGSERQQQFQISYEEYLSDIRTQHAGDEIAIINTLTEEINNPDNSNEFIGINLLARQECYYLWSDTENFFKYLNQTEKHLEKYGMNEERLDLYSMVSSRYLGNEQYQEAYIFIAKGEYLAKQLYEKNSDPEMLSTLIAIKYLKTVTALDMGLKQQADNVFAEAEMLRQTSNIRDRVDIFSNIITYYRTKNDMVSVEVYTEKLIALIEEVDPNLERYGGTYVQTKVIQAESYLALDKIDAMMTIVNWLKTEEDLTFKTNYRRYEIYQLYAKIYRYYGMSEAYVDYLEKAYYEIKDSKKSSEKLKVVQLIIADLEQKNQTDKLTQWYEIEREMYRQKEDVEDTRYLLNQLLDTDLQNAKYQIEILNLEKKQSQYIAIALLLLIAIVIGLSIIERRHKRLLKENINVLKRNQVIKEQYYENIRQNHADIQAIKHDMKNHMIIVQQLLLSGDNQSLQEYINTITNKLNYSDGDLLTNNQIVDAIVGSKRDVCERKGIIFECQIEIPEKLPIDEFDVCVIYGNLLDNAIEACQGDQQKMINGIIKLKNFVRGDYLFLSIENTYDGVIIEQNGQFITKKSDKRNHGIGLKSVQSTIEKYQGDYRASYTEEMFSVMIMIDITTSL